MPGYCELYTEGWVNSSVYSFPIYHPVFRPTSHSYSISYLALLRPKTLQATPQKDQLLLSGITSMHTPGCGFLCHASSVINPPFSSYLPDIWNLFCWWTCSWRTFSSSLCFYTFFFMKSYFKWTLRVWLFLFLTVLSGLVGILVSQPGIKTKLRTWILNHWRTREFLSCFLY